MNNEMSLRDQLLEEAKDIIGAVSMKTTSTEIFNDSVVWLQDFVTWEQLKEELLSQVPLADGSEEE